MPPRILSMITKSMAAGNHQPGRKQAEDRYLRRTNGRQLGQAAGRASPRLGGVVPGLMISPNTATATVWTSTACWPAGIGCGGSLLAEYQQRFRPAAGSLGQAQSFGDVLRAYWRALRNAEDAAADQLEHAG